MAIKLIIDEPVGGLTDQSDRLIYLAQTNFGLTLGQRGTAAFPLAVADDDNYAPTVGSPCYVYDPIDQRSYAGTIDNVSESWIGNDNLHVYTATCVSFEQVFDTIRVPPTAYFDMTAGAIFTDLYNTYAATLNVPVALGVVQDGPTVDSFVVRWDRLSDLFDKLKTLAQFIWGVQMSDLTLYFQEFETTPVPFELNSYLFETGQWKQERSDFRDRQLIQIAFTAFSTSNEMFAGDDTSAFINLFRRVDRITSACITTSTQATVRGIFGSLSPLSPSQPSPGDTFTIGNAGEEPYEWVTSLDNTTRNQVLIGATAADTAVNTFHAIQGTQIWKGIKFSLPTWENDLCNADLPVDNVFTLRVKNPGAGGNGILVNTTSATFHWSGASTGSGTDGVSNGLRVGLLGSGETGNDILYQSGSNQLLLAAAIAAGSSLSVAYYALGADTIAVEDSALVALRATVEHGSGRYDQIIVDTNNTDAISGYLEAKNALIAYKTLPKSFQFSVLNLAGWATGQLLTISIISPEGAPALLDGEWLVQSIQAEIVPGMEELPEPYGHFKYTIGVINVPVVGTETDFFQNLAIVTPAGSQSSVLNNVTIQQATPTLKNPATATPGSPTAGTPSTPAGQQWVQEAPGPYRQWKAKDLVVDGSDDTKVTSASRPFVSGDVDSFVTVTGGTGWTPGIYTVTAVVGVIATLNSSPAAVSTVKGEWQLSSGSLYALTWTPLASSYTSNQIAILAVNGLHFTPFAPATPGYVASGGAYEIVSKNQILFATALDPTTDTVIATYFPSGIVKEPEGPVAPDGDTAFVSIARSASGADQVETSPDAAAWTGVTSPTDNQGGTCIATDGAGTIVALALDSDGTTWIAITSVDHGATWTSNSIPQPNTSYADIVFGGGQFVACDLGGVIITSADGATWTQTATVTDFICGSIAFGAGLYAITGGGEGTTNDQAGAVITSPDAGTWTVQNTNVGGTGASAYTGICFGGGLFVVVSVPGIDPFGSFTGMTSPDGIAWTGNSLNGPLVDSPFANTVTFGAGVYVTSAGDTSPDGTSWTNNPISGIGTDNHIRFINSLFVICASAGSWAIATSADGAAFTPQTTSLDAASDVTFG